MKKRILRPAALLLAATTLFVACKKDNSTSGTKSRHDMIVGKWHQTLEAYDDNSNHVIDPNETQTVTDSLVITFNSDGSLASFQKDLNGIITNGTGTWQLTNSDATMIVSSGLYRDTVQVDKVDNTTLQWHYDQSPGSGTSQWGWSGFTKL